MNYLIIELEMCKVPRDLIVVKDTNMRMKRYKLVRCFWTRVKRMEHSVSSYTQNMV